MGGLSPLAATGNPAFSTSLGPSSTPGGFSGRSFGTPGLPQGFGFPSFGDPLFYFQPAASSFNINRLLGYANGSAVNINIGPTPSTMGFGGLLLGTPFFADSGVPGTGPFGNSGLGSFGGGAGPADANAGMGASAFGQPGAGSAPGGGIPGVVDPTGATAMAGAGASGFGGMSREALGMGPSLPSSFGGANPYASLGGGISPYAGLGGGTGFSPLSSLGGLGGSMGAFPASMGATPASATPPVQQQPQSSASNLLASVAKAILLLSVLGDK